MSTRSYAASRLPIAAHAGLICFRPHYGKLSRVSDAQGETGVSPSRSVGPKRSAARSSATPRPVWRRTRGYESMRTLMLPLWARGHAQTSLQRIILRQPEPPARRGAIQWTTRQIPARWTKIEVKREEDSTCGTPHRCEMYTAGLRPCGCSTRISLVRGGWYWIARDGAGQVRIQTVGREEPDLQRH
jgi:hypothetical protein